MCEMIFEVQGKTDNYVRLKKDGIGIKFLGNNNLRQVPNIKIICENNRHYKLMLLMFGYMQMKN